MCGESRRRLRDALVQLLIRKPVRDITVRELTDLAQVSRGTFYFHYGNIYELLDRLEQDQIDQINLFMDELAFPVWAGRRCPAALLALFTYLDEHDAICTALLGHNGDPAFVQRLQTVIAARCTGYLAPGRRRRAPALLDRLCGAGLLWGDFTLAAKRQAGINRRNGCRYLAVHPRRLAGKAAGTA